MSDKSILENYTASGWVGENKLSQDQLQSLFETIKFKEGMSEDLASDIMNSIHRSNKPFISEYLELLKLKKSKSQTLSTITNERINDLHKKTDKFASALNSLPERILDFMKKESKSPESDADEFFYRLKNDITTLQMLCTVSKATTSTGKDDTISAMVLESLIDAYIQITGEEPKRIHHHEKGENGEFKDFVSCYFARCVNDLNSLGINHYQLSGIVRKAIEAYGCIKE